MEDNRRQVATRTATWNAVTVTVTAKTVPLRISCRIFNIPHAHTVFNFENREIQNSKQSENQRDKGQR
jgi:hypothetical protein